jgi:hypothetical protein
MVVKVNNMVKLWKIYKKKYGNSVENSSMSMGKHPSVYGNFPFGLWNSGMENSRREDAWKSYLRSMEIFPSLCGNKYRNAVLE